MFRSTVDYLLLRTRTLLPERIRLPEDISPLVQKAYDEELWSPEDSPEYELAKDNYQVFRKKQRQRASGYCMVAPSRDEFFGTLVGLMDSTAAFTDLQARAAVRDGTASLEVLVVQQCGDGSMKLLSEQNDCQYRADTQPSDAECRLIAAQRLRLPPYFSESYLVDEVIAALEKQTKRLLPMWLQAPMMQGELFLILNPDRTVELAGKIFYYDSQIGLAEKEE